MLITDPVDQGAPCMANPHRRLSSSMHTPAHAQHAMPPLPPAACPLHLHATRHSGWHATWGHGRPSQGDGCIGTAAPFHDQTIVRKLAAAKQNHAMIKRLVALRVVIRMMRTWSSEWAAGQVYVSVCMHLVTGHGQRVHAPSDRSRSMAVTCCVSEHGICAVAGRRNAS